MKASGFVARRLAMVRLPCWLQRNMGLLGDRGEPDPLVDALLGRAAGGQEHGGGAGGKGRLGEPVGDCRADAASPEPRAYADPSQLAKAMVDGVADAGACRLTGGLHNGDHHHTATLGQPAKAGGVVRPGRLELLVGVVLDVGGRQILVVAGRP
jgi:hypothetical protein